MSAIEKNCHKCNRVIPLGGFYANRGMKDGYLNKCKECVNAESKVRLDNKKLNPEWVVAEAKRCREKQRKALANGTATKIPKLAQQVFGRAWVERNRKKRSAQQAIQNAVRDGRAVKGPCEKCGSLDSEGHHEDYSKPLEVIWLCPKHHGERHVEIRNIERRNNAMAKRKMLAQ